MRNLEIFDNKKLCEVWASIPIPGFHEYMISTYGEVMKKDGSGLLKQDTMFTGYKTVRLYGSNGKVFHARVHRLVAITFIPFPEKFIKKKLTANDLVVNHIDGKKTNNRVDNLEWVTTKGNAEHARDTGLLKYMGENSHLSKIDNITAEKCCKLLSEGLDFKSIAKELNISKKTVIHIKAGECWKQVSKNYTFPKNEKMKPNSVKEEIIHEICRLLDKKCNTDKEIADLFGLSREYVRDIRLGKRQRKISKFYNFSKDIN